MANGKIKFGKQSGGQLDLIIPDGASNTEVILPESGELANKEYVDVSISSPYVTIPQGVILMWSGSIASIPSGWVLCNGANGTPNLQDRFIVGAGSSYGVGVTGGSKDAIVVAHTHGGTTSSIGAHSHNVSFTIGYSSTENSTIAMSDSNKGTRTLTSSAAGASAASLTTSSTGESGVNKNLPPYYALAYIMKT